MELRLVGERRLSQESGGVDQARRNLTEYRAGKLIHIYVYIDKSISQTSGSRSKSVLRPAVPDQSKCVDHAASEQTSALSVRCGRNARTLNPASDYSV